LGWQVHRDEIAELLATSEFAAGAAWVDAHPALNSYAFSKEVVIAYCFQQAFSLIKRGIRINALCPSSTDTPLARRSFGWLEYGTDYREATGIDVAKPIEQAYALAFLCSPAASYVSGSYLSVDLGVNASRTMGTFVPAPPSMPAKAD
jgi:NAD(P)-dependent dehydrogenase (short-subunit alcohol dehydrogenase family)